MANLGRPKKEINQQQFETLCTMQCTQKEICLVLRVSEKTLNAWCKTMYNATFSQVFREKRATGAVSLRRAQYKKAVELLDTTMLIFLGKQYLGQMDKKEVDNSLREKLLRVQIEKAQAEAEIAKNTARALSLDLGDKVIFVDSEDEMKRYMEEHAHEYEDTDK